LTSENPSTEKKTDEPASTPGSSKNCGCWRAFCFENVGQLGQLLTGIAAVIAFLNTGNVLREVLDIKNIAESINKAVLEVRDLSSKTQQTLEEVKKLNEKMQSQLTDLVDREKNVKVEKAIKGGLGKPNLTRQQATHLLSTVISSKPVKSDGKVQLFIPAEAMRNVVDQVIATPDIEERKAIIKNNIRWKVEDSPEGAKSP
jgi:hypothetical protein